ncbi:hypothetical protein DIPPA_29890 [Diplonema papillatum]|nr:hypothetical protein DIPPA_29890 [Diplonema papillatum]
MLRSAGRWARPGKRFFMNRSEGQSGEPVWKKLLEEREKKDKMVEEEMESQRNIRHELINEANRVYEKELSRYKGTREEQIAQLEASRARWAWTTAILSRLYFDVYKAKSVIPWYLVTLLVAYAVYSCSFMASMDRGEIAY